MKADALQAASAERGEGVVMLQAPELAFNGGASPAETLLRLCTVAPATTNAGRESELPVSDLRPLTHHTCERLT